VSDRRQVQAVRRSYSGISTPDGRVAAFPLPRGGELQWTLRSIGGTPDNTLGTNFPLGIVYLLDVLADPNRAWDSITPDQALQAVAQSDQHATRDRGEPDASAFLKHRRQMDHVHGVYDPGPSRSARSLLPAMLAASAKKLA